MRYELTDVEWAAFLESRRGYLRASVLCLLADVGIKFPLVNEIDAVGNAGRQRPIGELLSH